MKTPSRKAASDARNSPSALASCAWEGRPSLYNDGGKAMMEDTMMAISGGGKAIIVQ